MPGTLFVVATPIGNLEDLSFRALRTLKEVDLIAAEDTRRTAKLLAHYEIRKSMVSLREHNEVRETPRLIARLAAGESIALVTDAGTPGIADPGAKLIAATHVAGIRVSPIPGPSAVTAALSASGLPADQYVFLGFPPTSGKAREAWMKSLLGEQRTAVLFEAPHRIERTLNELVSKLVERQIFVFREISKIHETLAILPNITSIGEIAALGEFCLVVAGTEEDSAEVIDNTGIFTLFQELTSSEPIGRDKATSIAAAVYGIDEITAAKIIKKAKISVDRLNRSGS
jgi:16S rRNA (cytidine1402-2'-O)-methyltransferase